MKILKVTLAPLFILFALFFSCLVQAQDDSPIGLILSTSGSVSAESEEGVVRQLRRRSAVFEGDTIITATRSRAQIRFNDNGLVSLSPDTRFVIDEHKFNGTEDGTENAAYRLLRGGIQAITGLIGNRDKSRYRFDTPLATIGLRGTHWTMTYCATSASCNGLPPGLYGGVAEGGVDVCNAAGCEPFEEEGYFYVPDANSPPQKLIDPPGIIFGDSSERGEGESEGESSDEETRETSGEQAEREEETFGVFVTEQGENEETEEEFDPRDRLDDDTDNDGVPDDEDAFPNDPTETADTDGDGVGDNADAFPEDETEIADTDGDGVGDNADVFPEDETEIADTDGDGVGDNADAFPEDETEIADTDGDGVGDNADVFPEDETEIADTDGDGVGDNADAFPNDETEIADTDGDGVGDNADAFPNDETEIADTDGDGVGDNADVFPEDETEIADTDGDGVGDNADAFPNDETEIADTDGDGVGDNADVFPEDETEIADTDGDGVGDNADAFPNDETEVADTDGDGVGDNADVFPNDETEIADTDGDGVGDNADAFPEDETEIADTDGDGVGDNADVFPNDETEIADTDGDGVGDNADVFPNDETEVADNDMDGIGNNADPYPEYVTESAPSDAGIAIAAPTGEGSEDLSSIRVSFIPDESLDVVVGTVDGAGNVFLSVTDSNEFCDPDCELTIIEGELAEHDGVTDFAGLGFGVNWGRWNISDSVLRQSGIEGILGDNLHYIYSPNVMDFNEAETYLSGFDKSTIAKYSLQGGTSPTDQLGNVGTLNHLDMTLNYGSQTITAFDIDLDVNSQNYVASLYSEESVNSEEILLVGHVGEESSDHTLYGQAGYLFVGDQAEGIMGSYNLNHVAEGFSTEENPETFTLITPDNVVSGAYLLGRDSVESFDFDRDFDPTESGDGVALGAAVISTETGNQQAGSYGAIADFGNIIDLADVDGANTVVSVSVQDTDIHPVTSEIIEINCDPCIDLELANLAESGQVSDESYAIDFGRWYADRASGEFYDYSTLQERSLSIVPDIHYVYTEDSALQPDINGNALIASYSYLDGTTPTNELGELATSTAISASIDFYRQQLTGFDLDVTVSDRQYLASMDDASESVAIEDLVYGAGEIELTGSCIGGDCGESLEMEGVSTAVLVGTGADYLAGTFGLNTVGHDIDNDIVASTDFIALTGAYVLGNNSFTPLDDFFDRSVTPLIEPQPESGAVVSSYLKDCIFCSNYYVLAGVRYSQLDADLVSIGSADVPTNFGYDDSVGVGMRLETGVLDEFSGHSFSSGAEASWGRWFSADVTSGSSSYEVYPDIHFGLSEYLYDFNVASGINKFLSYKLVGGTSPTDETGTTGSLDRLEIILDLYSNTVAAMDLDLTIGDRSYYAYADDFSDNAEEGVSSLSSLDSASLSALAYYGYGSSLSSGMNLNLSGTCTGGDCGELTYISGNTVLDFIGDQTSFGHAEGILGAYSLEAFNSLARANGSFLLEQDAVLNFDFSSSTASPVPGATAIGTVNLFGASFIAAHQVVDTGQNEGANSIGFSVVDSPLYNVDSVLTDVSSGTYSVAVLDGVVVDFGEYRIGRNSEIETSWGLWDANFDISADSVPLSILGFMPYAYADVVTTTLPDSPLTSFDAEPDPEVTGYYYGLGGSAVDQSGTIFSTSSSMTIDFGSQMMTYLYLSGESKDGDLYYYADSGSTPTSLSVGGFDVALDGSYQDYSGEGIFENLSGSTSVLLVGDNAEGAIGSFSLSSPSEIGLGDYQVAGAYVLEQYYIQSWYEASADLSEVIPNGAVALGATIVDASALSSGELALSGAATTAEVADISVYGISGSTRAVVSGQFNGGSETLGSDVAFDVDLQQAELVAYGSTNDLYLSEPKEYEAYWGRWTTYDQVDVDSTIMDNLGDQFVYAYSDDLTDVTASHLADVTVVYTDVVSGLASTQNADYAYISDVYMSVDFGSQSITAFDLDVDVGGQFWDASMSETSVALEGSAISSISLTGDILESGTAVDIIEGNAHTAILGGNADAVLGTFNMSAMSTEQDVIGTFLVEPDTISNDL